jgi:Protein of unknown function (DUF2934)
MLRGSLEGKGPPRPTTRKAVRCSPEKGTFVTGERFEVAPPAIRGGRLERAERGWQMDDQEERIRRLAHEIWVLEGRPEGREADHWFQAQEFIRTEDFLINVSTPNPALEAEAVALDNDGESGRSLAYDSSGAGPTEVPSSTEAVPAPTRSRPTAKRMLPAKGMETFRSGAKPTRPLLPQWSGVR